MNKEKRKSDDIEQMSEQDKRQMIESIKNDIKKDIFAWIKKRGGLILTIVGILGFIGYQVSLRQIYNDVRRFITNSIAEKFAEPNIRATLTEVAKNQAKEIIENEIRPEIKYIKEESKKEYDMLTEDIKEIKKEVTLFKEYLDNTKSNISVEYSTLANEVEILKERNRLIELADKAIGVGDSEAFEQLKNYVNFPTKTKLLNAAKAEMLRVKNFYIGTTRIKGATITYVTPTGEKLVDEKIPTEILLNDLANHKDWRIRAKAAQLLKDRIEKGVPEALLEAMRTDSILDVRRDSLQSFESLTGFKRSDVLDYEPAVHWWERNKQQFEEKLNKKEKSNN